MEIKIQCACGTRYAFDAEPVNRRMPVMVQCPSCKMDGTPLANAYIAQHLPPAQMVGAPAMPGNRLQTVGASATLAAPPAPPVAQYAASSGALLDRTSFFVKERTGFLKLTDVFDILDPVTGQTIGIAKEEPPAWAKWLRLVVKKQLMPTTVNIYDQEGMPPVASIHRGFTILRSKVKVVTGGQQIGYFKSKLLSIGGGFYVYDNQNQQIAEVKGNWKGWDFKFIGKNGKEIGSVSKKWAGLGKELFTSADNYMISLTDLNGSSPVAATLLLAAGLAIDVIYKEAE